MNQRQRWLAVVILLMALLLVACGGGAPQPTTEQGGDDAGTDQPAATNTVVAEAEEEPTEEPAEPTEEPEEEPAEEPTEAAADEEPTEEAEEEPTEESTDEEADAGDETVEGRSLFDVEGINSFRLRMSIATEGEAFEDEASAMMANLSVEGEFVKEPPAQRLSIDTGEASEENPFTNVEMIQLEETSYMNLGTGWTEVPGGGEDLLSGLDTFTLIDPEAMDIDLDEMERVGEEEVSGRDTVHLRGGPEFVLGFMSQDDEAFNLEDAEEAQLDFWIDQEDNFVVRMELVAEGVGINTDNPDANGRMEISVEYYDFNEDITIDAPEVASLGDMLGLDLELPEGSEMGFASDGFATATVPLSLEEAGEFIEEAMAANGLELDVDASLPDVGSYTFTAEDRTITVFLAEEGDGTSITISVEAAE